MGKNINIENRAFTFGLTDDRFKMDNKNMAKAIIRDAISKLSLELGIAGNNEQMGKFCLSSTCEVVGSGNRRLVVFDSLDIKERLFPGFVFSSENPEHMRKVEYIRDALSEKRSTATWIGFKNESEVAKAIKEESSAKEEQVSSSQKKPNPKR